MFASVGRLCVCQLFHDDPEGVFLDICEIEVGVISLIVHEVENPLWRVEFVRHQQRGYRA